MRYLPLMIALLAGPAWAEQEWAASSQLREELQDVSRLLGRVQAQLDRLTEQSAALREQIDAMPPADVLAVVRAEQKRIVDRMDALTSRVERIEQQPAHDPVAAFGRTTMVLAPPPQPPTATVVVPPPTSNPHTRIKPPPAPPVAYGYQPAATMLHTYPVTSAPVRVGSGRVWRVPNWPPTHQVRYRSYPSYDRYCDPWWRSNTYRRYRLNHRYRYVRGWHIRIGSSGVGGWVHW